MLQTVLQYRFFYDDVGFLRFKQDYLENKVWKTAFYVHVFTSLFALLAGFTQFSGYILKHHRSLHRVMGKLYVIFVLFINFPVAMVMAVNANGLLPARIAFVLLDLLWCWFTLKAVLAIRKKDIVSHQRFMIRSYALTFSAITLRSWKIILSGLFILDPQTLYMIEAWIGFVPNLLLAEIIIRRIKPKQRSALPVHVRQDIQGQKGQ